jgi:hypothetical protein
LERGIAMQNKGIVDQAKGFLGDFNLKNVISGTDAASIAVYFASFFVVGVLFKKYFKHILIYTLITVFILKSLEYYSILSDLRSLIDWKVLNEFLGVKTGGLNLSGSASVFIAWVRENLILFLASSLGFLFGYKVG